MYIHMVGNSNNEKDAEVQLIKNLWNGFYVYIV